MKRLKIISFVLILIAAQLTIAQDNIELPYEGATTVNMPVDVNTYFLKDGKMGVGRQTNSKFEEILKPEYDLIAPTNEDHLFICYKDGVYSVYDYKFKKMSATGAKSSLRMFGNFDGYKIIFQLDNEDYRQYKLQDESGEYELQTPEKENEYGDRELVTGIEKLNENEFMIQHKGIDYWSELIPITSVMYPGEDSITDQGDVLYYPRKGSQFSGIYNHGKDSWTIQPDLLFIRKIKQGFILEKMIDDPKDKDRKISAVSLIGPDYMTLVSLKSPDDFSQDDTLAFLPEGTELLNWTKLGMSTYEPFHYRLNGKVGLYSLNFYYEFGAVLPPIYDMIVPSYLTGSYILLKDGKMSYFDRETNDFVVENITDRIHIFQSDYENGGNEMIGVNNSYALNFESNYKERYELDYYVEPGPETDIKYEFKKITDPDVFKNEKVLFEIQKIKSGQYLISVNNLEEYLVAIESVDYPGEDSLDLNGDVLYYEPEGSEFAGVYDVQKKEWIVDGFNKIEKTKNGYITGIREPGWTYYYARQKEYKIGLVNANFKEVLPPIYRSLEEIEDVIIGTTSSREVGAYDHDGRELIKPSSEYYGLNYRDGYFYTTSRLLESIDYPGEDSLDLEGNVVYSKSLLVSKSGKQINIPYTPITVYGNGIVSVVSPSTLLSPYSEPHVGFFDLNQNKLIHEIDMKFFDSGPDNKDFYWIQEKGKWSRFTIDTELSNVGNEKYDAISLLSIDGRSYLKTEKNGLNGLSTLKGKSILSCKYRFKEEKKLYSAGKTVIVIEESGKKGFYSLSDLKYILPITYDDIDIAYQEPIRVTKNGLHGLINESDIKEDCSVKWTMKPLYPGKLYSKSGFYLMESDKKYGAIDKEGNTLVPMEYDKLYRLDKINVDGMDGLFLSARKIIDGTSKADLYHNDKIILSGNYSRIQNGPAPHLVWIALSKESNGKASEKLWGVYNLKTKSELLPCVYDDMATTDGKDDQLWIRDQGKWGLLDFEGKELIPPSFDSIYQMSPRNYKNIWVVRKDWQFGLFDADKSQVIGQITYDKLEWGEDRQYILSSKNGKKGVINLASLKAHVEPKYDRYESLDRFRIGVNEGQYDLLDFNENGHKVVVAGANKIVAYYNHIYVQKKAAVELLNFDDLSVAFQSNYDELIDGEDHYIIVQEGKFGILASRDSLYESVKPQYDIIEHYEDTLFFAGQKNPWAYLDQSYQTGMITETGDVTIPLEYSMIWDEMDGLKVSKGGKSYTLNWKGKLVEKTE